MPGSYEVDPPHEQQLIINKEAVSLTSSLMHYFSPVRALITGLSLPLPHVYFPIKTIVTASGNSNHLNLRSFVEDRGL